MQTIFTEKYLNWLKENVEETVVDKNTIRITFPFLDRNNDNIEFYIINNGKGSLIITDDGYTINEIELAGMNFNDETKIIDDFINKNDVYVDINKNLFIMANQNNVPEKLHAFIQCLIELNNFQIT